VILRFLQRHAGIVAMLAGATAYELVLPDSSPWWMKLGVGLVVLVPTYLLLYRYGVTQAGGKAR
jgi:hypothetical protein